MPNGKGQVWIRCMNHGQKPLTLQLGEAVGSYTATEAIQSVEEQVCTTSWKAVDQVPLGREVPPHLETLYERGKALCEDQSQLEQFTSLLNRYQGVFSAGEHDARHTSLIQHSIQVAKDTRPIRLPPHHLGPLKEEKAERQAQGLLDRGLIEPTYGAWSSPVVLAITGVSMQSLRRTLILPHIDESLDALAGSQDFSIQGLGSRY